MKTTAILLTLGLVAAVGCSKKAEAPPATPAAATPAQTPAAAATAKPAAADVPTEVDFESDSKTKITDKNLETKVQALEKEIGK